MRIGEKIRKIRELKGIKQEYLASKLNISIAAYSNIERNLSDVNWERIECIAEALEVSPLDLVSFDDKYVFNQLHNKNAYGVVNKSSMDDDAMSKLLTKILEQQDSLAQIMAKIIEKL